MSELDSPKKLISRSYVLIIVTLTLMFIISPLQSLAATTSYLYGVSFKLLNLDGSLVTTTTNLTDSGNLTTGWANTSQHAESQSLGGVSANRLTHNTVLDSDSDGISGTTTVELRGNGGVVLRTLTINKAIDTIDFPVTTGIYTVFIRGGNAEPVRVRDINLIYDDSLIDTTPPANVTSLTAVEGDSKVTLNYTLPSDSDFTNVKIYRNSVLLNTTTASSYVDTTVTNGVPYVYKVTSVDDDGNESSGVTVNATPLAVDLTAPSEVMNLTETHTGTTINLSFSLPSDGDFDHVNVYLDDVLLGQTTNNAYEISGLAYSTSYHLKFTTVDTKDNESSGALLTVRTDDIELGGPVDPPDPTDPPEPSGPKIFPSLDSTLGIVSESKEFTKIFESLLLIVIGLFVSFRMILFVRNLFFR